MDREATIVGFRLRVLSSSRQASFLHSLSGQKGGELLGLQRGLLVDGFLIVLRLNNELAATLYDIACRFALAVQGVGRDHGIAYELTVKG